MRLPALPTGTLRLLGAVLLLALAPASAARAGHTVDRIVAVVNDQAITLSELEEKARPALAAAGRTDRRRVLAEVLDRMVDDILVTEEAKRLHIEVSDAEVRDTMARIAKSNGTTVEAMLQELARQGIDRERYESELKNQILRARVVNFRVRSQVVVTPADVEAAIRELPPEKTPKAPKGPQYVLRHILFMPRGQGPEAEAEARRRAEAALKALDAGEDFAALAARYSDAPTGQDGGYLGAFSPEDLSPEIRRVVEHLPAGGHSPVVLTPSGFQIFQLQEVLRGPEAARRLLEEKVRARLYQRQFERRLEEWVRELRKKAAIRILL
ncbi:peptidylprolyl isomerase [Dissulfurirhabdus thermomarina]|uniref:Peptidylprolyl isomerase n=1 Tax=Dissulfurirhabdus thermomarina TaxID=1765737 RepID=A0A6N9TRX2_DISTH|nr:peptidylprolyl isomerase [Dissulfurirhabdus thermomarina]NDY42853.1 peptidylprolyl isomerase [Dissulfurirhabdus thermomarina]NMX23498.1 peptidylprolyl isomerase [Dissulfurirhabdus thermomarina]